MNLYDAGRRGRAITYAGLRKLLLRSGTRIGYADRSAHASPHPGHSVGAWHRLRAAGNGRQAVLGHCSLNSTQVYTHDLERAKQAALAALAPRSVVLGQTR